MDTPKVTGLYKPMDDTTDAKLLVALLNILKKQYKEVDGGDYVGSINTLNRIIKERDDLYSQIKRDDVLNRVPL